MFIELVGGPWDGKLFNRSSTPSPLVWVSESGACFTQPDEGRLLHKLTGRSRSSVTGELIVRYAYAHYELARCESCGWFGVRSESGCWLCLTPLST